MLDSDEFLGETTHLTRTNSYSLSIFGVYKYLNIANTLNNCKFFYIDNTFR